MAINTKLRKINIKYGEIDRDLLNVSTATKAVVAKVLPNNTDFVTNYTGADFGTGDVAFELKPQTGLTAGMYRYVTVNSKGIITNGFNSLDTFIANTILTSSDLISYPMPNNDVPVPGTLMVYLSGQLQYFGVDKDYTFNSETNSIVFNSVNEVTQIVSVSYFLSDNPDAPNYLIGNEFLTTLNPSGGCTQYRLGNIPENSSVQIYLNGQLVLPGVTNDYVRNLRDVTFNFNLSIEDIVTASYIKA